MRNVHVNADINRQLSELENTLEISAERTLRNLAMIANGSVGDFISTTPEGNPVIDFIRSDLSHSAHSHTTTASRANDRAVAITGLR